MCTNLALTQLNNKNPLALYSNIQDLYTNKLRLTTNPTDIILNKYTQPWTREAHSTAMTHLTTKILKTKNSKKKWWNPYLGTLGAGNEGFADIANFEDRRSLDVVPILLCKGIGSALIISGWKLKQQKLIRPIQNLIKLWYCTHAFFLPPFFPLEILLFFLS